MTGGQVSYTFTPWLDANVWVVNRWESETTHDDFNDNNRDKSFGARIGFTPLARQGLLNLGVGAFFGPEQDDNNSTSAGSLTLTPPGHPCRACWSLASWCMAGRRT